MPCTYNGLAKSMPILVNDGALLILSAGKSGMIGEGKAFPSYHLYTNNTFPYYSLYNAMPLDNPIFFPHSSQGF